MLEAQPIDRSDGSEPRQTDLGDQSLSAEASDDAKTDDPTAQGKNDGSITRSESVEKATKAEKQVDSFIKAPDGSVDFGQINSEISQQITLQPGAIRLQEGEHKGSHKGYGRAHIKAEYPEIADIESFVSRVADDYSAIYKSRAGRLRLVKESSPSELLVVEIRPSDGGDFYTVVSAHKSRKVSGELLWSGAQSHPTDSGSQPALSETESLEQTGENRSSARQPVTETSITQDESGTPGVGEDNGGADGMLYSKSAVLPDGVTPKGISVKEAELYVKTFLKKFKGADDIVLRVYRSQERTFDSGSRAKYGKIKAGFDPKTNSLHVIAANLDGAKDTRETLQHEVLVHKGLGLFSENDEAAIIDAILENAPLSEALTSLWNEVQKTTPINRRESRPKSCWQSWRKGDTAKSIVTLIKYWPRSVVFLSTWEGLNPAWGAAT
ncbi:MAG: hypothetical protein KUG71_02150 [Porticoccaceae bacterium]|nr:hypothetical protein [Porticoccaceae bacterium]